MGELLQSAAVGVDRVEVAVLLLGGCPEEDQLAVGRPVGAVSGVEAPGRELTEVGAVGVDDEERATVSRLAGRRVAHIEDEPLPVR